MRQLLQPPHALSTDREDCQPIVSGSPAMEERTHRPVGATCLGAAAPNLVADGGRTKRHMRNLYVAALMMFAIVAVPNATQPSSHQGHGAHAGMSMPVDAEPMTPESRAKL